MSLSVICGECNKEFAYFSSFGTNDNIDKIYAVSKSIGDRGATFDKSKLKDSVYLCETCFKEKLPNLYSYMLGL